MSDLLKKLTILKDKRIIIDNNLDFRNLYLTRKITLIDGILKYSEKLTDEYLSHKHEVYTGRKEKSYTDNWITFRTLISAYLVFSEENIILTIRVDDGDSCYGIFTGTRWKGDFRVNISEISIFENDINNEFDTEIDRQFSRKEELRIQKEKDKIRKKLLE